MISIVLSSPLFEDIFSDVLASGEPLAFVEELPCFNNSIKLDPLLGSALELFFHNMIIGFFLYVVGVGIF
jgi:hypothetical protein